MMKTILFRVACIVGILFSTIITDSPAQEKILIYSEADSESLKGKKGKPTQSLYVYEKGKLTYDADWTREARERGWQFSFSKDGRAIYARRIKTSGKKSTFGFFPVDLTAPPELKTSDSVYQREFNGEPLNPGLGSAICWSPSGKKFFIREPFKLTVFEPGKKPVTLEKIVWTYGTAWGKDDNRITVSEVFGQKVWDVKLPASGRKTFDPKAKPMLTLSPINRPDFEEKVADRCFRIQYSPNGKYLAYVRMPGKRPLPNIDVMEVSKYNYNGPVTGSSRLRIGVRGKSVEALKLPNSKKLVDEKSFKNGFSNKKMVTGQYWDLDWNRITPIDWSPKSDYFYFTVTQSKGHTYWDNSKRPRDLTKAKMVKNELWRSSPTGKTSKVCDLTYLPDSERYFGDSGSAFPQTNEARISSDGKYLLYWGSGTSFYKKNQVEIKYVDLHGMISGRASKFARYLILVDLATGKQQRIFKASERSRTYSVASFASENLKVTKLTALDANPKFIGDGRKLPSQLLPTELIQAKEVRKGTTADGVSQLVIRAEVTQKAKVHFELDESQGKLEKLLDGRTVTLQGRHYAFALYTPPKSFGGGASKTRPKSLFESAAVPRKRRSGTTLEIEDLKIEAVPIRPSSSSSKPQFVERGRKKLLIQLARPPVVLVHGLFSNPIECWVATKSTGASFVYLLEHSGFVPFLVNYENSNGAPPKLDSLRDARKGESPARDSSFHSNRFVVWDSPDGTPREVDFGDYRWLKLDGESQDSWLYEKNEKGLSRFQKPSKLRIGGIKQALEFYRNDLDIAATQGIVMGHSMGGLLARVYADPDYHPEYKRIENFEKGDIHRLITICTPHHGSELAMVYNEILQNLHINNESITQWARRHLQNRILLALLDPNSNALRDLHYRSKALQKIGRTEIPSFAIGTTAEMEDFKNRQVDPFEKYAKLYSGIGMVLFFNQPRLEAFVERRALRWSNAPEHLKKKTDRGEVDAVDWSDEKERAAFKELFLANMDQHSYYWAQRREGAYREQLRKQITETALVPFGMVDQSMGEEQPSLKQQLGSLASTFVLGGDATRLKEHTREPDMPQEVIEMIRALIFHNDPKNDGAVRLHSQLGGIGAKKEIRGVVHSFATWDYQVQRVAIDLIKWEDQKFFKGTGENAEPHTFGPAGQLMPYFLPSLRLKDPIVRGERAISWSGMYRPHVEQFRLTSEDKDAVIICRPINQDSTKLIELGAATKGMDVKGKSSSWGPQKGYIPREQRFSKLWRVYQNDPGTRQSKIDTFNAKTEKMIANGKYPMDGEPEEYRGRPFAVARELEVDLPETMDKSARKIKFAVMIIPGQKGDAEQSVFLKNTENGKYHDWRTAIDTQGDQDVKIFHRDYPAPEFNPQPSSEIIDQLVPMEVIADGLQNKNPAPYLTADYDLLAIGFYNQGFDGPHPDVQKAMDSGVLTPLTGYISPDQWSLVKQLNRRVKHGAEYESGNVTHHGPETQYPGSEYVDYPLLVFDPGKPKSESSEDDATVFVIRQGPPGFRDIHLKRYVWQKRLQKHNLWPNPVSTGWLWEKIREYSDERGYAPGDAQGLQAYVAEQSERSKKIRGINQQPVADSKPGSPIEKLKADAQAGDAKSQFKLGFAYSSGKDIEKNDELAVKWYQKAAEQGHRVAQYNLALRYSNGKGVEPHAGKAMYWLEKSAQAGYASAQASLGYRYRYGTAGIQDNAKAKFWYEKAAAQNNATALNNLGVLYKGGYGVKKDVNKAREYFEKAAKLNNGLANKNLGDLYYYGTGVKKDVAKAIRYYEAAIKAGYKKAEKALERAKGK